MATSESAAIQEANYDEDVDGGARENLTAAAAEEVQQKWLSDVLHSSPAPMATQGERGTVLIGRRFYPVTI